jgi:hypothetical protein
MCIVEKNVGKSVGVFVSSSYPHFDANLRSFQGGTYPPVLLSVYNLLSRLLGFPRSYNYY